MSRDRPELSPETRHCRGHPRRLRPGSTTNRDEIPLPGYPGFERPRPEGPRNACQHPGRMATPRPRAFLGSVLVLAEPQLEIDAARASADHWSRSQTSRHSHTVTTRRSLGPQEAVSCRSPRSLAPRVPLPLQRPRARSLSWLASQRAVPRSSPHGGASLIWPAPRRPRGTVSATQSPAAAARRGHRRAPSRLP
jgi:hypothetical protein